MRLSVLVLTGLMFFLMSFQEGNSKTDPQKEQNNKSTKEEKVEVLDVDKALEDLEKKEFRVIKQKPIEKKKAQDFDTDSGW
ncbi:MAG: hypothetical protein KTR26_02895 [Flammeovirgaceae bacterium]|nr:hypothetical protein [Flammeovirgaceae bacterium]